MFSEATRTRAPCLKEDGNGWDFGSSALSRTLSGRVSLGAAVVECRVRLQVVARRSAAVVALREGSVRTRCRRWVPSSKSLDATVAAPHSVFQLSI